MSNVPATPSAATPADVDRRIHQTIRRLNRDSRTTLRFGRCGGILRTRDGRSYYVRSYSEALAVAFSLGLRIDRTSREV